MRITIDIKETPRGDVEISLDSAGMEKATRKERCYAQNLRDLLKRELPVLGKALGAKAAIFGGDPKLS